jgi:hypothetical protein
MKMEKVDKIMGVIQKLCEEEGISFYAKFKPLVEIDEELKQKINNFTNALSELPHELFVELKVLLDGKESEGNNLKLNLSNLLIEQVKSHFNK